MKNLIVILIALFTMNTLASSIEGIVKYESSKKITGVLYIFAKNFKSKRPMPVAVKRIENPKFPVKFKLDKSNTMIPDTPFKGPFTITARISPSGSAMDKSGIEVKTDKPIKIGDKIELSLK